MKRIYEKSELAFSIIWIVIYVVVMNVADSFSTLVTIEKVFTAPIAITLVGVLLIWIKKLGLSKKYGLIQGKYPTKIYLFFIPLILTLTINFWHGLSIRYNMLETILFNIYRDIR